MLNVAHTAHTYKIDQIHEAKRIHKDMEQQTHSYEYIYILSNLHFMLCLFQPMVWTHVSIFIVILPTYRGYTLEQMEANCRNIWRLTVGTYGGQLLEHMDSICSDVHLQNTSYTRKKTEHMEVNCRNIWGLTVGTYRL